MVAESWGRLPKAKQQLRPMTWRSDSIPEVDGYTMLPHGLGRSYGDSCLNDGGVLITTTGMDRLIALDTENGIITCEGGVSFAEILRIIVPHGWFLPVTPGTKFVTVGGAIANDIHGKNHHVAGTFGSHVQAFELLRSDGERLTCSPTENKDWFAATIGGMGLTGLITHATFQLKAIHNPYIDMESIKLRNLDEFFEVDAESLDTFEYTVSWIDVLAKGSRLGRGLYMRGNTALPDARGKSHSGKTRVVPLDAPGFALNHLTIKLFNTAYYQRQQRKRVNKVEHYEPFFYPLDSIHAWNKLYGRRGFYQHQCVVPYSDSRDHIQTLLKTISDSGQGSFLAVLKVFGDHESPGLLSFPRPGVTLALDFANLGNKTLDLMNRLDEIVNNCGGAIYPAKDARMSADSFKTHFPHWETLHAFIDPAFSSSFWRRVTEG